MKQVKKVFCITNFYTSYKIKQKKFIKYLKKDKGYDSYLLDENIVSFKAKLKTIIHY